MHTSEWEGADVPVDPTSTATYWGDAPVAASSSASWSDYVAPTSTPVVPVVASTWVDVPVAASSTPSKPVASYTKPGAPVAQYTGAAAHLTGAGLAGVAAVAAMLL